MSPDRPNSDEKLEPGRERDDVDDSVMTSGPATSDELRRPEGGGSPGTRAVPGAGRVGVSASFLIAPSGPAGNLSFDLLKAPVSASASAGKRGWAPLTHLPAEVSGRKLPLATPLSPPPGQGNPGP